MSVLQKVAFYPNERFDTPDARSIEAFSLNDWTHFLNGFFADRPYVLTGFEVFNYSSIFSTSGFELKLDDVVMFIPSGTEPGFYVYAGTEQNESVILSPNSINFVEAEFEVVSGVPDIRAFWDTAANENEGAEYTDTVDTVLNLNLKITSNITGFTPGKVPLYRVVTDNNNIVTSLKDARFLFWRLGTGGAVPDPNYSFQFPDLPDPTHARLETPAEATGFTATNAPFQGGDKNFKTFKDWIDVVMTLFKETNGTPYWYMAPVSGGIPGAYQNAALTLLNGGTWQHSESALGTLSLSGGSTLIRFGRSDLPTLSPFTDLDMTTISPNTLFVMLEADESPSVAYDMGEDGATPVLVGNVSGVTTTTVTIETNRNFIEAGGNIVIRNQQFSYTSYTPGTGVFSGVSPDPTGLVQTGDHVYQGSDSGAGFYHFGETAEVPGLTSDGVSEGAERTLWLAHWDGSIIRVKNGDLEQGEQIQVGDETPLQVINYTGMSNEADMWPDFSAKGSPERFVVDDTDDLTDAIANLDAEMDKYTGQLRLVEKTGTSRAIVTGADKIMRDNSTLSIEIKNLLMSFDGAEIDFDSGTIYESDGLTPLDSFTPATIAAGQWRWYSISIYPTTITSDNKYEIGFTVNPAPADGATKSAAQRARFASGAIRLGQVAIQESGGSVKNVEQADIVYIGLSGEEDEDSGATGPFTLTGSQTDAVSSNLSFDSSEIKGRKIDFIITDGTNRRIGTIYVTVNEAADDAEIMEAGVETGTGPGVTWDVQMNGTTVEVLYTTTAGNKTMKADITQFR